MRFLNQLLALPLATAVFLACSATPSALAQESVARTSEGLDRKATALKGQIDALLEDENPEAASNALRKALDAKSIPIKTESDMTRLFSLHHAIAFGFHRNHKPDEAVDELVTSFDEVLGRP
ncbi:MAG: hypothetical protein AAF745_19435, partial [Planctomycetota bacterium]